MTQNNHCTLLIDINKHNNIKCSIIDSENKEQQIKINENQQDEYSPICIAFDMNEIIVNEQREDSIDFFVDWIEQPDEFKEYEITYQNKQYSVISEVLFGIWNCAPTLWAPKAELSTHVLYNILSVL